MTDGADHDRVAQLVDRVTSGSADTGRLANDVLRDFQRGLPVDGLLVLVRHQDPDVAELGAWIAAELGAAAAPLADDMVAQLKSPSRVVRYYAIDVVLAGAVGARSGLVAQVLPLLDETDDAVRWKATGLLVRASTGQLESALDVLTSTSSNDPHIALVRWLLSSEARNPGMVRERLSAEDPLTRRYAVAAAARLSEVTDEPLRAASASAADADLRRFASDWLGMTRPAGSSQPGQIP